MLTLQRLRQFAVRGGTPLSRFGCYFHLGPQWPVGELCHIHSQGTQHTALVTGFREGELVLQPLGHVDGIRPGDCVEALGRGLDIAVGDALVGRVIDALGNPMDRKPAPLLTSRRNIHAAPAKPLRAYAH